MSTTSARPPRLDLVRNHAVHFSLLGNLARTPATSEAFRSLLGPERQDQYRQCWDDEDWEDDPLSFMSLTKYRRSSTEHVITEFVSIDDVESGFSIRLSYDVNSDGNLYPLGTVPKPLAHEGEVFRRLLGLVDAVMLACHGHFRFTPEESGPVVATAFPLPLRMEGEAVRLPFDEIRGVRGVKYATSEEMENGYAFVLDRPSNDSVFLTLNSSLVERVTQTTPEIAFTRAAETARTLVSLRPRRTRS